MPSSMEPQSDRPAIAGRHDTGPMSDGGQTDESPNDAEVAIAEAAIGEKEDTKRSKPRSQTMQSGERCYTYALLYRRVRWYGPLPNRHGDKQSDVDEAFVNQVFIEVRGMFSAEEIERAFDYSTPLMEEPKQRVRQAICRIVEKNHKKAWYKPTKDGKERPPDINLSPEWEACLCDQRDAESNAMDKFHEALLAFPPKERDIILERIFGDVSLEKQAEKLGWSVKKLRIFWGQAKEKLARALHEG